MLSAFGEPPASGKSSPACAAGAATKAPASAAAARAAGDGEYVLRARGRQYMDARGAFAPSGQ